MSSRNTPVGNRLADKTASFGNELVDRATEAKDAMSDMAATATKKVDEGRCGLSGQCRIRGPGTSGRTPRRATCEGIGVCGSRPFEHDRRLHAHPRRQTGDGRCGDRSEKQSRARTASRRSVRIRARPRAHARLTSTRKEVGGGRGSFGFRRIAGHPSQRAGHSPDTLLEKVDASFLNTSLTARGGVVKRPGKGGLYRRTRRRHRRWTTRGCAADGGQDADPADVWRPEDDHALRAAAGRS